MKSLVQFYHCLASLHVGSGEGMGSIDRPLIREATTGWPLIPSGTLKGAWNAMADSQTWRDRAFGPRFGSETSAQGWLSFLDAGVAWFPVESQVGTMAWVTCPLALARLLRGFRLAESNVSAAPGGAARQTPALVDALNDLLERVIRLTGDQAVASSQVLRAIGNRYLVGDLSLSVDPDQERQQRLRCVAERMADVLGPDNAAYARDFFKDRCLLVSDDHFNTLIRHGTEVEANIAIEPEGVTKEGSLRYTEYLPAETILWSAVIDMEPKEQDSLITSYQTFADDKVIQFGGDESKGKGFCWSRVP